MCARYISDQNKVVFLHESGTYAVSSGNGIWPGEVTDHTITDSENKLVNYYLGTASRSYGSIEQGPRDVTGKLTYNAQDMMIPFIAIGSVVSTSGTNSFHVVTEVDTDVQQSAFTSGTLNPLRSFTLEDSKQAPGTGANFIRTINGCTADTTTITATQSEKVNVVCDYLGQTLDFSSGTTTSLTQVNTTPYLWSSVSLTLSGNSIDTAKEISLEINQNLTGPHYLNGSRDISVPYQGNREYMLNVTLDLDSSTAKLLYNDLYKNKAQFNAIFDLNQDSSAGSQHTVFNLSGCEIMNMENPSVSEGLTETTIEIKPQFVGGSEWNTVANFNPW